jgi:myo-inositol-1(or 4)-monophosphatase
MDTPTPHTPATPPRGDALAVVTAARAHARDALDEVRAVVMAGWGRSGRRDKADGTPVTDVDLLVDRTMVGGIREAFPDHAVVSEEGMTRWDGSAWTWIVDPIDGTTNYAAGVPYWATSLALAHRGEVVWGLVDAPALDLRIEAVRGHGTTSNGDPVHVAAPVDLTDPATRHAPMAVSPGTIRQVIDGTYFKARILGAYALDLALVAEGSLVAAFLRVPKVWDVAAGMLLVTEAGGGIVEFSTPGNLPLQPDVELATRGVRTAAGPNAEWAAQATTRLWPKG